MVSKKNIIVTIGNYGSIIAVHDVKAVKSKVFLKREDFNDQNKEKISEIFKKNKDLPVYVLIDTVDQTYKKKTFPFLNSSDLKKLATRTLNSESGKDSLKNFTIINKKTVRNLDKKDRHWDCLFITSPLSPDIKNWISFLIEMPNYLAGVHMLPVECFNLFKLLKKSLFTHKEEKMARAKNDLYCIIMQNKVSGIRQIVFSQDSIVFTRVVNYDFNTSDFIEKFEHDIYGTFEYLKRIYSDLQIHEIKVITVLPENINKNIAENNTGEINYRHFTPIEIAEKIGYKDVITPKSKYCDLLVSKIFSSTPKLMKFHTPKLKYIEKFYYSLQSTHYINLFFSLVISGLILYIIITKQSFGSKIEKAQIEEFKASNKVKSLKINTLKDAQYNKKGVNLSFERISDFGKIEEVLGVYDNDIFSFYSKLSYFKKVNLKVKEFSYSVNNFVFDKPNNNAKYEFKVEGSLFNNSGDIEDLFREFDTLLVETKKTFSDKEITFSELPKDIDFTKKYYSFPINFVITTKENANFQN